MPVCTGMGAVTQYSSVGIANYLQYMKFAMQYCKLLQYYSIKQKILQKYFQCFKKSIAPIHGMYAHVCMHAHAFIIHSVAVFPYSTKGKSVILTLSSLACH